MLPLSVNQFPQQPQALSQGLNAPVMSGNASSGLASLSGLGNNSARPQFARSVSPQQPPMLQMMLMLMQLVQQMLQMFMGQGQAGGGVTQPQPQQPGTNPYPPATDQQPQPPVTNPYPPVTDPYAPVPGGQTPNQPGPVNPNPGTSDPDTDPVNPNPGTNPGPSSAPLSQDDLVNYVLAGSKGGTAMTDEGIFGKYADPNSRFAQAGANEFDAVIAKAYAAQFKAYALGEDVVFNPGQDQPETIAANIMKGQQAKFTPEAETLAQVAAVYRGDLGGQSEYNNAALKDLLVSWGRQDLANREFVGVADVQSIGSVVQALNEQEDPAVRQEWLQQIFDFKGNSGTSPSGAVPNAQAYQDSINIVRNGTLDQLIDNYHNGVKTSGPIGQQPGPTNPNPADPDTDPTNPNPGTDPVDPNPGNDPVDPQQPDNVLSTPDIDRNINFSSLSKAQRSELGLSDRERGILHLWGRQVLSTGFNDGSIYNNVIDPKTGELTGFGTAAEQQLIQELRTKELQQFGHINGKLLDQEAFALLQRIDPNLDPAKVQQYLNAPERVSDGKPVQIANDLNTLRQRTGFNDFEQAVLRLVGHEPLFNGGKIDGSIMAYTVGNQLSLDSTSRAGQQGAGIDNFAQALLDADFASDGIRNGDSLSSAFVDVLDKAYLGQGGASVDKTQQRAEELAKANGRTPQQVAMDVEQGMVQAMKDAAGFVKDHPIVSTVGVGTMAAATAICPFLGGMALGAAGIAAGQKFLNGEAQPAQAA